MNVLKQTVSCWGRVKRPVCLSVVLFCMTLCACVCILYGHLCDICLYITVSFSLPTGIPELVTGLRAGGYGAAGPDASIASSLNDLYGSLAASADPLFPHRFWAALKARYAQFGETSEM